MYVFAGSKDIAEYTNGAAPASPAREYICSSGQLVATLTNTTTTYHHRDHLSVRVTTDANGNKIGEFLILDRDAKYGLEVPAAVRSLGISPVRTSFESPWQNGLAERWVESCRRDLLDHIIAVNKRHLKRLLSEYVCYHHEDRTHLGLGKGTPKGRIRSTASGRILSQKRLGGLHHRYDRAV